MAWSAQGVISIAFRDSSGGEDHDTSQTPTSQVLGPRYIHSEIGVCIVFVDLSRGIAKQIDVEAIRRRHDKYSSH